MTPEEMVKAALKRRNFLKSSRPGGNRNGIWVSSEQFLLSDYMTGTEHTFCHRKVLKNDRGVFALSWKTNSLYDSVQVRIRGAIPGTKREQLSPWRTIVDRLECMGSQIEASLTRMYSRNGQEFNEETDGIFRSG